MPQVYTAFSSRALVAIAQSAKAIEAKLPSADKCDLSGVEPSAGKYIKRNGNWMLAALRDQMPMAPANAAK
jgi:hypothetical protein